MSVKTLHVDLGERSYPIHIGEGLLTRVPEYLMNKGITTKQTLFIVTDENIAPLYLHSLQTSLREQGFTVHSAVVPAGEQAKQFSIYEQVITQAINAGLDRKSLVMALGGGVVGDLAGFVAATYMRGISFVQLPTTLLAHDSSVGGKVAINHRLGKNLIGAFHQPEMVIYDTSTLRSLPKREVAAGFAEVVKHALISDASFADWLEEHAEALWELEGDVLAEAIYRGCQVKANIVAEDETEQGARALLNLGHTFGHAFEALLHYSKLNHGEAISIGMRLAAVTAERLALAAPGTEARTVQLLERFHLPTRWPDDCEPEEVLTVMHRDKKTVAGKLVLVLQREIGRVEICKDIDDQLVLQIMTEAKEKQ